ncbi:fluoride efflux transporter FluC [Kitasatospora sp. NPDC056327]|uniref:fluoride efflux transporter FluC n=1 Tax=Kitasatospora sp. NPDC056327 TaxID=3345785 RepID=UPI0035E3B4AD
MERRRDRSALAAQLAVVPAVALGGGLGSVTRYGVERLWPVTGAEFPWPVPLINATGCLAMGVLMTLLKERFPGAPKSLGPLLGTGFLGGFTTFSHFADDVRVLAGNGEPGLAVGDVVLTSFLAIAAVLLGILGTREVLRGRRPEEA